MEPEGSLTRPEELANGTYPEAQMHIINTISFLFYCIFLLSLSSLQDSRQNTARISPLYPLCKPI